MSLQPSSILQRAVADGVVVAAVTVAFLEGVSRIVLSIVVAPLLEGLWSFVVPILWPPVVAAVGLGVAVASARTAGADEGNADSTWLDRFRNRGPALLAVGVGGHLFAVVTGAALFLVIDTPVRYALYAFGYGDLLAPTVVVFGAFLGLAVGALIAWAIPALAVVRVADGASPRDGLREAVAFGFETPRAVGRLLACHVGFVGVLATTILGLGWWLDRTTNAGLEVGSVDGVVLPLAVGGLVLVFGAAAFLALSLSLALEVVDAATPGSSGRPSPSIPVARLALALLLVTALVAAAGAVRAGDVRPVDAAPEPLPDDPDGIYETALDNTDRSAHAYRYWTDGGEQLEMETRLDRSERQLKMLPGGDGPPTYYTSAVAYGRFGGPFGEPEAIPVPGYLEWEAQEVASNASPRVGEPNPAVRNWTVREETDDELVLELEDPNDVYVALTGMELEEAYDEPEVHEAAGTMTVDPERKTLVDGEFRLALTDWAEVDSSDDEVDGEIDGDDDSGGVESGVTTRDQVDESSADEVHEAVSDDEPTAEGMDTDHELTYAADVELAYEVDIDVERPDGVGSPGPGELFWRLFAY